MKRCPRCSAELSLVDKACPKCGLLVSQMEEMRKKFNLSGDETTETTAVPSKKDLKNAKKEEKKQAKQAKKDEKRKKKEVEELDFSQFAVNSGVPDPDEILETDTYSEKRKKRKKLQSKPRFIIDENGEFNIGTEDVEIVGEETGKMLEQQYEQSYSIKKSRGDYIPPRLKWWEIYKVADRHFARNKIKKEVNKAAKIKPNYVKKSTLLLLSIFLGWMGAHNFYAKNYRKGWFSVALLFTWVGVVTLSLYSSFFALISTSIGGGAGFICLFIWISDTINIISNQFKYKFQRTRFISGLNVETRAKLGKKYIDMDLYRKPLWYRFKVWCSEVRKNSQIRKRERRQAAIEREKRRMAAQEEKEKIDSEIAAFEEKENQQLVKKKSNNIVDDRTLEELKSFGEETSFSAKKVDAEVEDEPVEETAEVETKEEKTEAENSNVTSESENANKTEKSTKKHTNHTPRKYEKTVKNKKAEQKKRKK